MTATLTILPCWHANGWESASEFSVQDASRVTRAEAHQNFQREVGELWTEIGVWKRYIREWTRLDKYIWWVEANDWRDDETGGGWDEHPDTPPEDWKPDPWDEDMPAWEFVHPSHPDAIPVWVCGMQMDGPPQKPRSAHLDRTEQDQPNNDQEVTP